MKFEVLSILTINNKVSAFAIGALNSSIPLTDNPPEYNGQNQNIPTYMFSQMNSKSLSTLSDSDDDLYPLNKMPQMNFFTKDTYGGEDDYTVEFQAPADVSEEIVLDV